MLTAAAVVPPFPSEIVSEILAFLLPGDGSTAATVTTLILVANRLGGEDDARSVKRPSFLMSVDQLAAKGMFEYIAQYHSVHVLLRTPHPKIGPWYLKRFEIRCPAQFDGQDISFTVKDHHRMCSAAAGGHLCVLRWFKDQGFNCSAIAVVPILKAAVRSGQSDALWLAWKMFDYPVVVNAILRWAAEEGQISIMEECLERNADDLEDALVGGASNGRLAAMSWLKCLGADVTPPMIAGAIYHGQLAALGLLKTWWPMMPNPIVIAAAAGQVTIMQWCKSWLRNEELLVLALDKAITYRHSRSCQLCLEWGALSMSPTTLNRFVQWSKFDVLDTFFDHISTEGQYSIIINALILDQKLDALCHLRPKYAQLLERVGEPAILHNTFIRIYLDDVYVDPPRRFNELHDHWGQTLDKIPVQELICLSICHGRPGMLRTLREWGVSPRELDDIQPCVHLVSFNSSNSSMPNMLRELRENWGATTYAAAGGGLRALLEQIWAHGSGCQSELRDNWGFVPGQLD